MIELKTKLTGVIQRTPTVKSFRFEAEDDVEFKAGQYFLLTIDVNGEKRTKPFSFSNSPTEKGYIEFTKRLTESPFSNALTNLKVGDTARLKLPYGTFTLKDQYERIVFLSGGVGITPIRSICKYVDDSGAPTDITLIYSNRSPGDIIFREDFDKMDRSPDNNIRVIYTFTSDAKDIAKEDKCRIGHIDERMIKADVPDYNERVFYVCGPPKMVEYMCEILKDKLGITGDKIRLENFAGY